MIFEKAPNIFLILMYPICYLLQYGCSCNLLRPLIKTRCILVPYGYILTKIKRIPKEMTGRLRVGIRSLEATFGV